MTSIWVVWKYEDYDTYSLVSAHRTKEEAIKAGLAECFLTPEEVVDNYNENGCVWYARLSFGNCVMVNELPLAPKPKKEVKP